MQEPKLKLLTKVEGSNGGCVTAAVVVVGCDNPTFASANETLT